jgi:AcrR family transcriptional regulator
MEEGVGQNGVEGEGADGKGAEEGTRAGGPRTASLTERRIARTRRQLAEAAAALFLERGYDAVTVEEIAATVEVSPRTFFRYFASKDDVLDEILVNEAEALTDALRERPAAEPLLGSLRAAAHTWVNAVHGDPRTLALFALVLRTPVLTTHWLVRRRNCQEPLAQILEERLGPGVGRQAPLLAAGAMIGLVATIFDFWVEDLEQAELLARIDEAIDLLADGFGLAPAGQE